jgi:hypothetical protein
MGHFVTGLVSDSKTLQLFSRKHSLHPPVLLSQGFCFLPLPADTIDLIVKLPNTGYADGFTYLSEQLISELSDASFVGPIVYLETEYFGGRGAQGAAAFVGGRVVFGPLSGEAGPINEALKVLGAKVLAPARDEFDALGLNQHRHTEDWLESTL